MQIDKYNLNLAGEYRVCSEILKRGIFATVTYGNKKGADIVAVGANRRAALVEVKASNSLRFVTSFYRKHKSQNTSSSAIDAQPTFWVLYSVVGNEPDYVERFFVLSHEEMAEAQAERNAPGETLTYTERVERWSNGVDNVVLEYIAEYEDCWHKIVNYCNDPI
jgi:hypothetical protein